MLELTVGQQKALDMAQELSKRNGKVHIGVISGWAGTGKSTLLKVINDQVGSSVLLAPTGKAALRVKELSGLDAGTIHSWLYHAKEDKHTGDITFSKKDIYEIAKSKSRLIVIDEASMVGEELLLDIVEICVQIQHNILLVGDDFQLPPVSTVSKPNLTIFDNILKVDYRVHLDEVLRQALESPIIRASIKVREGDILTALMDLERAFKKDYIQKAIEYNLSSGVTICHTNETRHMLNDSIRKILGYNKEIASTEPLLIIKNNHGLERYNGEIFVFEGWDGVAVREFQVHDRFAKTKESVIFGKSKLKDANIVLCPNQIFGLTKSSGYAIEKAAKSYCKDAFLHANLGYALTCHKAQGSQWPKVLVVIEKTLNLNSEFGKRWIYVAITRAEKEVTLCYLP